MSRIYTGVVPRVSSCNWAKRALTSSIARTLTIAAARLPVISCLPIKLPRSRPPIAIVTLKNRTLSPIAELFIQHARELANRWLIS